MHLSKTVVETRLGDETRVGVWHHQIRWHAIRVSRGAYVGLTVTNATLWAGAPGGSPSAWAPPIPLRDLWGFAVWVVGSTVHRRGKLLPHEAIDLRDVNQSRVLIH